MLWKQVTHRYPALRSESSYSLQLFVWYVDRYRQSCWVSVAQLIVVIDFGYPPAFVGYPLYKTRSKCCNTLPLTVSRASVLHLNIPVFCTQRWCHTPSSRFREKPARTQRQRFATKSGGENNQLKKSVMTTRVWLRVAHQAVGDRKSKFHQRIKNRFSECVLYLFVSKS